MPPGNAKGNTSKHRPIRVESEVQPFATLIHLDWSKSL